MYPKTSLVIPCFNESENVPRLTREIEVSVVSRFENFQLVLVDNGSTDDTRKNILELAEQHSWIKPILIDENIGYGDGILKGLASCKEAEVVSWTHADMQVSCRDYAKILEFFFLNECEMVVGKRTGREIRPLILTFGMSMISWMLLGHWFDDINGQPKVFRRKIYDSVFFNDPPKDFSLDLFLLLVCRKLKIDWVSFPVKFGNRLGGESKGGENPRLKWSIVLRTVAFIWQLRGRKFDSSSRASTE